MFKSWIHIGLSEGNANHPTWGQPCWRCPGSGRASADWEKLQGGSGCAGCGSGVERQANPTGRHCAGGHPGSWQHQFLAQAQGTSTTLTAPATQRVKGARVRVSDDKSAFYHRKPKPILKIQLPINIVQYTQVKRLRETERKKLTDRQR